MKSPNRFNPTVARKVGLLLSCFFLSVPMLRSGTLLSVTGPPVGGDAVLFDGQWVAQRWNFTEHFVDVSVTANVRLGGVAGTAWLMDAIGSGTTSTNVLNSVSFDSPGYGTITFFRNLDLLPRSYYFILTVDSGEGGWRASVPASVLTVPGVSYGGFVFANSANDPLDLSFPPASTWRFGGDNLGFRIGGFPAGIPEPSGLMLSGLGLSVLAAWRLRIILLRRSALLVVPQLASKAARTTGPRATGKYGNASSSIGSSGSGEPLCSL